MKTAKKANIILVGFSGSGKTVIGRTLAQLLEFEFADTDEYIREVTGMELARLYRKYGEIRFRSEEKLAVRHLMAAEHQVIACGGSLLPSADCLELLQQNGYFVLLTAPAETIMDRLKRKGDRILLPQKLNMENVAKLIREREACFARIPHITVNSGSVEVEEAAAEIAAAYRAYLQEEDNAASF